MGTGDKDFIYLCDLFFGAGITVMGYNNDVDMVKVFGQLYKVFLGTKPDDPTFVELFYSVGLALGIFLFFNHVPGKRLQMNQHQFRCRCAFTSRM